MKYADVIIDISHEKLDKTFQYIIPAAMEETLVVGMLVHVPFGRGNTLRDAYVVGISQSPSFDISKMKYIASIPESRLPVEGRLIQLAAWMKTNFGATMSQALKTVLPVKETVNGRTRKYVCLNVSQNELSDYLAKISGNRTLAARARLLEALMDNPRIEQDMAAAKLSVSAQTIKSLEKTGMIRVEEEKKFRNPVSQGVRKDDRKLLNEKQKYIVDSFCEDYAHGIRKTYLIHGVTGSGKTEVYMNMIENVVNQGRQVIMLIPEIALTYQTVMRFYQRFGDTVSILNSRMSKGERYDQFVRAKRGDISIMIGPRSALFTPFADIGLIVIDEEHEATYKSETSPRYNAIDTAIHMAGLADASVVLGSATPSVVSYARCMDGRYRLFTLSDRAAGASMTKVHTIDLRDELKSGNRSIFSRKLQELIADRLNKGEQSMLFINKRGYAGFVSCRSCGHVMRCPHCDISLTEHTNGKLVCHYCGYETPMVKRCPECGSPYISGFRAGTEQIEQLVKRMYPQARVLRMDMDTTGGKDGHTRILEKFAGHEADILVGTQMIVKGHDFPDVTLVGVLAADMSLYAGSYMASERTFQLLVQAVGRAGRGKRTGEAVIQTYTPEHYSIQAASKQDYEEFYNQEIQYRTLLNYPPVCNLLLVRFSSVDEDALNRAVKTLPKPDESSQVIGPANASLYKANDIYNKVLYIKNPDYAILTEYAQRMEMLAQTDSSYRKVNVQFDFNPVNI